jgi:dihydrofolate synthase/folylpolyglutamate synthase
VASALSSILHRSGYSVGLYTSPHLVRFNERIQVDNLPISDSEVVDAYQAVKRVHSGDREPTFFEFATAMALYGFGRRNVDWAVIETGMGGRLDATNMVSPALTIITNVSMEHREYLGNTLPEIAFEKAGIIKNRVPVITGLRQKKAVAVARDTAKKKSAPLYRFRTDFKVRRHSDGLFTYYGLDNVWRDLQTNMLGSYQVDNAALVLASIEILNQAHTDIDLEIIRSGLAGNHWPGRLEIVGKKPLVILDGAHNFMAARNLAQYIGHNLADKKITFVIGILDDKPYQVMLKSLLPLGSRVIFTKARIDRAMPPEALYPVAKEILPDVTIIPDVTAAINQALNTASADEVVCIAGSLYVVGEAKEALEKGLIRVND